MVASLVVAGSGRLNQAFRWAGPPVAREFPALSRAFFTSGETLISHGAVRHHASMNTGMSEASSNTAMTTLKIRTAAGEVRNERNEVPNSVQTSEDEPAITNITAAW